MKLPSNAILPGRRQGCIAALALLSSASPILSAQCDVGNASCYLSGVGSNNAMEANFCYARARALSENLTPNGARQQALQAALKGADRVTVREVAPSNKPAKPFVVSGAAKIAQLIASMEFDDRGSNFECTCCGDTLVTFYKGNKKLAELGHHHANSLRWHGGQWKGHSRFTEASYKAWCEWFAAQGENRFVQIKQQKDAKKATAVGNSDALISVYKPEAKKIFANYKVDMDKFMKKREGFNGGQVQLGRSAKKLAALYPDANEFATVLARSLGKLPKSGGNDGSWTCYGKEEFLVIECAEAMQAEVFRTLLESKDEEVLLGAARLFFGEQFSELIPEEQRAAYAAKLARVVVQRDRYDNADSVLLYLAKYNCPQTLQLLEDIAKFKLKSEPQLVPLKNDPMLPAAACVMLAKLKGRNPIALCRALEKSVYLDQTDQAALKVARALAGQGRLDHTIFEISSFTIALNALSVLEQQADKAALDAIINGATKHDYALVRERSVLSVERITGLKWYKNGEEERAEWSAPDIREWWKQNRDSWESPKKNSNPPPKA